MGCGSGIHGDSDYTINTLGQLNSMNTALTGTTYVEAITFDNFYNSVSDFTPDTTNKITELNTSMNDFNNLGITIGTLCINNSFNGTGINDTIAMANINYFSNDITVNDQVIIYDSFIGITNTDLFSVKGDVNEIDICGSFKEFGLRNLENINDSSSVFKNITSVTDNTRIRDSFRSMGPPFGGGGAEVGLEDKIYTVSLFNNLQRTNKLDIDNSFRDAAGINDTFKQCNNINDVTIVNNSFKSFTTPNAILHPEVSINNLLIDNSMYAVTIVNDYNFINCKTLTGKLTIRNNSFREFGNENDNGPDLFKDVTDLNEVDIDNSFYNCNIDSVFNSCQTINGSLTIRNSFINFGNTYSNADLFKDVTELNEVDIDNSFYSCQIESLFNNCETINNSLTIRNSITSCNLNGLFNNLTHINDSLTLYNSFNTYSNDAINIIDNSSLSEKYDYILNTLVIQGAGPSPKFEKIESIGSNLTIQYSLGSGSLEVNDFSNLQTIGGDFNLKALINSAVLNNNFDKLREIGGNLEIVTAVITCNNNLIFSDLESVGKKITIKDLSFLQNGQTRGNMFPSLNNIGDSEMEISDSFINMQNNFGPSAPNLKIINDLVIYNSFKSYGPNDSAAVFNSDLFNGVNDITNLTITNSFMNFNDQSMFRSLNDVDTFTIISNDLIEPYGVDVTTNDSFTNYEITTSIFNDLQNGEINNRNFPAYLVAVPPFPLSN